MTVDKFNFKQKASVIQEILDKAADLPDAEQLSMQVSKMQAVTYAELKALRDGGELVPGRLYRITDYVTTLPEEVGAFTGEVMERSAGHAYDLVVVALSGSVLSENALAMLHDGDEYFAGANLAAWQLKYCLDNDTERFRWLASANGKGVVYWMKDEWGNEASFDFKNIQFKRYTVKTRSQVYASPYALGQYKIVSYFQSLFNNKTIVAPFANRAMWIHDYYGYRSEQWLYDNDAATWQDGPNPQSGGTRMFVNLYSSDDVEILVEVEHGEWYYTFSKKNSDADVPSDRSLEGAIENMSMLFREHRVPNNVFLTSAHSSVVDGEHNTFGSVFYSSVRSSSNCVADMYSSTIGPVALVCASELGESIVSGSVEYLMVSGAIRRSNVAGQVYRAYVEGDMSDTVIGGEISDTWINGASDCVFSRCRVQNCEIEADQGLVMTSVEGVFDGRTWDFADTLVDTDQSWMLINVNGNPRLVSVSDILAQS